MPHMPRMSASHASHASLARILSTLVCFCGGGGTFFYFHFIYNVSYCIKIINTFTASNLHVSRWRRTSL